MHMSSFNWFLLTLLSVLWGGSFFFVAVAIEEMSVLSLLFYRVFIAAIVLYLIILIKKERVIINKGTLLMSLAMGLTNNLIPFGFLFWAQTVVSSSLAAVLNSTVPVFSIILAHFFLADERMQLHKLMGILMSVIGVVVLLNIIAGVSLSTFGVLACLVATFSYATAGVINRSFKQLNIKPLVLACGQLVMSSIIMMPFILFFEPPWQSVIPSGKVIAALLGLTVFSTAFAYIIYFRLIASAGAVNASLVTLLIPVSAIILGVSILGDEFKTYHYFGTACIMLGLLAIDGRIVNLLKTNKN